MKLSITYTGFDKLTIISHQDMVIVVMESTGHYHYPVLKELYETGVYVSVVNAFY